MKTQPGKKSKKTSENNPVTRLTRSSIRKNLLAISLDRNDEPPLLTPDKPAGDSLTDAEWCSKFGCKELSIRLELQSTHKTDDDELLKQFGFRRCCVALQRLTTIDATISSNMLQKPVVQLHRIDHEPVNNRPPSPIPAAASTSASSTNSQHVPVYAAAKPAEAIGTGASTVSATTAAAGPSNVFDFMSMSQDDSDNDDTMRAVIEKLHNENRIELKRNKRVGGGIATKSKPAIKRTRKAKAPAVKAPTVQPQPTERLPKVLPNWPAISPSRFPEPESLVAEPEPKSLVAEPEPESLVAEPMPPMPPPALPALKPRPVLNLLKKLMHQPTHQSTPIRAGPTVADASAAVQQTTADGNSSPWRVTDENLPRTFYFSSSTGDLLPSFSSDSIAVSYSVPANHTADNTVNSNKRPAEDALAAAMETQKRPKVTGVAATANNATDAVEQQPQKRLNFSESISDSDQLTDQTPTVLIDYTVHAGDTDHTAVFASTLQPAHDQHSTPLPAPAPAPPAPQPSTSAGGGSDNGSLNDSNTENIEPENHAAMLAAIKAKATRIVLGERCPVRSPLRPLAIRNVMLSPHVNSALSSSSTDESVAFGSPTPIHRLQLMSATPRTPPQQLQQQQQQPSMAEEAHSNTPPLHSSNSGPNDQASVSSLHLADASNPPLNDVTDALHAAENTPPKPAAPPVNAHRKNLNDCFGFDSESETDDAAAADASQHVRMVINPFALRKNLKELHKLRPASRPSGPRRMLPPPPPATRPATQVPSSAAVQLFKDVTVGPKHTIQKSLRQQRERSTAAAAADSETVPIETPSLADESSLASSTARKSSMAPASFNNFVRGLELPIAPLDKDEPALFEARWPEQNNVSIKHRNRTIHTYAILSVFRQPNRKSYSRPFRKRQVNTECDTSISDDDDDDDVVEDVDEDVDALTASERAKQRRANRKARRKEMEEAKTVCETLQSSMKMISCNI